MNQVEDSREGINLGYELTVTGCPITTEASFAAAYISVHSVRASCIMMARIIKFTLVCTCKRRYCYV